MVGPRFLRVGYTEGRAIAIQSDGSIVAVGLRYNECVSGGSPAWGIARYLPNGSLDSSFGSGGMVTLAAGGMYGPYAVVVQPVDGKIVVVGSWYQSTGKKSYASLPVVVRFNPNGSLDGTFGSGGMASVSPAGGGSFRSVALQSDGKIVAAGISGATASTGLVSRLTQNGALDTTFNGSGSYFYTSPTTVWFNAVTTQVVAGQERIVVAGGARDSLNHPIGAIWRFGAGGSLDASFGGSGMVTTSFHDIEDSLYHEDMFLDVAVDSSGRIVGAGYSEAYVTQQPLQMQLALARYGPDGTLDPTFGDAGRVWASSNMVYNVGRALVIQPEGKIVVAGQSSDGSGNAETGGVWRVNSDGTVDATFGSGGWVLDPIISGSYVALWQGMALQPDGMIVCGGDVIMRGGTSMVTYAAIARFWQ